MFSHITKQQSLPRIEQAYMIWLIAYLRISFLNDTVPIIVCAYTQPQCIWHTCTPAHALSYMCVCIYHTYINLISRHMSTYGLTSLL